MLARGRIPLRVVTGELELGRNWIVDLFGWMPKKKLMSVKKGGRHTPTHPELRRNDARESMHESGVLVHGTRGIRRLMVGEITHSLVSADSSVRADELALGDGAGRTPQAFSMRIQPLLTVVACAVILAVAPAQSFNVDVGPTSSGSGVPSPAYGAGAGQPGTWNAFGSSVSGQPLVDVNGAATPVVLECSSFQLSTEATSGTTGDDEALLDDFQSLGSGTNYYYFHNLVSGRYALYTYAWTGDDLAQSLVNGVSLPCGSTDSPPQIIGVGAWSGQNVLGETYAIHRMDVPNGGTLCIEVFGYSFGRVNGFQLVREGDAQVAVFCEGDGSGTVCPCGNAGIGGRGCAHSVDPRGANLWLGGTPSISNDSVVFAAQWMPSSSSILIEGTTRVAGGQGAVFGDGLRCVGGAVRRLGVHSNTSPVGPGTSLWPANGELPISSGAPLVAGSVRHYQVWFRNAAAFCTPEAFNQTNGVSVTWQP